MKYQKTVCHEINRSIEMMEHAIKTGDLDALLLTKRLETINTQAQDMENGLRLRRKMMKEAGIEEAYQKAKGEKKTPPGINKVADRKEKQTTVEQRRKYQVVVKEDGEVVYDVETVAGVLCLVENIFDMDDQGVMTGQTQKMMFGHDLAIWYGFDQLQIAMRSRSMQMLTAITTALKGKAVFTPQLREQLRKATNQ